MKKNPQGTPAQPIDPAARELANAAAALDDLEHQPEPGEYRPDTGDTAAPGGPPGAWRPDPARIERIKPKVMALYVMACSGAADQMGVPELAASGQEADAVAQALAELADALLPVDNGEVTRGSVAVGAVLTVGGIAFVKRVQYHAAMQERAAQSPPPPQADRDAHAPQ